MSVITITKDNFESEVLKSPVPVLLDFWATWCGPCRMVSPIVDEIAEESDGSYKVGKINVDEQPELASQFRVMSIPTLVVMKDGAVYKSSIGMQPKAAILALPDRVTALHLKHLSDLYRQVFFFWGECVILVHRIFDLKQEAVYGRTGYQGNRLGTAGTDPADGAVSLLPLPTDPSGR